MPILLKEYTWTETLSTAYLTVPIKSVNPNKADIYSNDVYVKINYPPYLFELDLLHDIDDESSIASIGNDCVKFELQKVEHKLWGTLKYSGEDAHRVLKRRQEGIERKHKRIEEDRKRKIEEKAEKDRLMIKELMEVERAERKRLETLKQEEKLAAEQELFQWSNEISSSKPADVTSDHEEDRNLNNASSQNSIVEDSVVDSDRSTPNIFLESEENVQSDARQLQEESSDEDDPELQELRKRKQAIKEGKIQLNQTGKELPPPRSSANISIKFTQRQFRTAARESQDAKWMEAMERSKARKDGKARKIEEATPIFYRDKANEFYRLGNYQAAINAYSSGLAIDPQNVPCLSNRAACHLQLQDYESCIEDCTAAINTLKQEIDKLVDMGLTEEQTTALRDKKRASMVKLYVRRGSALAQFGQRAEGIADYKAAVEIDTKNEGLLADLRALENHGIS
ncbi:hypothetical protein BKA69DRAFT_521024 [Paraphysoderma sedebokerense]|nr:hypothetical protein BKA69DRAFT_521024 [Paraphysoderma sedebokerense]